MRICSLNKAKNSFFIFILCAGLTGLQASTGVAQSNETINLKSLQNIESRSSKGDPNALLFNKGDAENAALQIRQDSQKEAARSYGARGGLIWRSQQIHDTLLKHAPALDNAFNFRQLLIKAPTNLLIEPPIIREAIDALLVSSGGQEAAVADRIYNISKDARIVTAPRTWETYLMRTWDQELLPPPNILLPETPQERENWKRWVEEGWREGVKQADGIFEDDLSNLMADYEGMIRYRILLAEGKVSPPYAVLEDRGITGGGREMRIGDRAVRITGQSRLKANTGGQTWTPGLR